MITNSNEGAAGMGWEDYFQNAGFHVFGNLHAIHIESESSLLFLKHLSSHS